jgi:hypothetical protein
MNSKQAFVVVAQRDARAIVHRIRGSARGPISRLMSPSDPDGLLESVYRRPRNRFRKSRQEYHHTGHVAVVTARPSSETTIRLCAHYERSHSSYCSGQRCCSRRWREHRARV